MTSNDETITLWYFTSLDIYLPEAEKPIYPVVVVIYGSAWFGNAIKEKLLMMKSLSLWIRK